MSIIVDNDTIYDEDLQRYYLTPDYVLNKLGTNLQTILVDEFSSNTANLPNEAIEESCDILYNYLEQNAFDKTTAIFRICTEQKTYNLFKKALGYQLLFYIHQGDISLDLTKTNIDGVNRKAIQLLRSIELFNTKYYDIPEDVEDW